MQTRRILSAQQLRVKDKRFARRQCRLGRLKPSRSDPGENQQRGKKANSDAAPGVSSASCCIARSHQAAIRDCPPRILHEKRPRRAETVQPAPKCAFLAYPIVLVVVVLDFVGRGKRTDCQQR